MSSVQNKHQLNPNHIFSRPSPGGYYYSRPSTGGQPAPSPSHSQQSASSHHPRGAPMSQPIGMFLIKLFLSFFPVFYYRFPLLYSSFFAFCSIFADLWFSEMSSFFVRFHRFSQILSWKTYFNTYVSFWKFFFRFTLISNSIRSISG